MPRSREKLVSSCSWQDVLPLVRRERVERCEYQANRPRWLDEEFLKHHPNGGAATAGFVAVRLSDGQIEKQRDLIRISSYRWKEVKGVGPNTALEPKIPSNYATSKVIFWCDVACVLV